MKDLKSYAIGAIFALAPSSAAWAQHKDLEVTMDVVPLNATPRAPTAEIELPETASRQAQEAAESGLETANKARKLKARERARDHVPKKPPRPKGD